MRAAAIFVVFFLLFVLMSIAVSVPLFPGNMVHRWFTALLPAYNPYVEAVTNGLVYGCATWMVFFVVSRRMDKSLSRDYRHSQTEPTLTGEKKNPEKDPIGQEIPGSISTEQQSELELLSKSRKEPAKIAGRESPPPNETRNTESSKETRDSRCPYQFGYLYKHARNTQIPNECLTCTIVMECMTKVK